MKYFDNIESIWQYVLWCPLCKSFDRDVSLSVGPDDDYSFIKYNKDGYNLVITSSIKPIKSRYRYDVTYYINCLLNTYEFNVYNLDNPDYTSLLGDSSIFSSFFFYLQSSCESCFNTGVYTADIELENGMVFNIMLEREDVYLFSGKKKYRVSYYYDEGRVKIARCWYSNGELKFSKKRFVKDLPFDLDFSNIDKALNRISTLLTFS
jgi:hypothetical protein